MLKFAIYDSVVFPNHYDDYLSFQRNNIFNVINDQVNDDQHWKNLHRSINYYAHIIVQKPNIGNDVKCVFQQTHPDVNFQNDDQYENP